METTINWEALGAVAELLGSVAVVITLLFLVKQIKTNSVMTQNATVQASSDALGNWSRQLTTNPELFRLYRSGLRGDALGNEDRALFDQVAFQAFNAISSVYLQYRNGGLAEDRWDSEMRIFAAILNTRGGRASWERQKSLLDVNFAEEVESRFDFDTTDA